MVVKDKDEEGKRWTALVLPEVYNTIQLIKRHTTGIRFFSGESPMVLLRLSFIMGITITSVGGNDAGFQ